MAKKDDDSKYEPGGMAFVGFILLGVAFGLLTGQVAVGAIAGVGLGFIAMGIISRNR